MPLARLGWTIESLKPGIGHATYSPIFHGIALTTVAATLLMIGMGGLVTSHGAGLAVPDWPNSFGYNMFLFPPRLWIGGIFYEHTHRLMGTVVGLLSIALVIIALLVEQRRWVILLSVGVLGAVIFQGILGGLRVVLLKLDLAVAHACVAQAFLCLVVSLAVVTSRAWLNASDLSNSNKAPAGRSLVRLACIALAVIYLQLIVGACMRHFGAGLAIPDLPLAYGKVLPPATASQLDAINQQRAWMSATPGAKRPLIRWTLGQIWLHFGHRMGAILVTLVILLLVVSIVLRHRQQSMLLWPAISLLGLLAIQITLGVLTVLWRKPADVAMRMLHAASAR